MQNFLNWSAVILILAASTGTLLSRDWRWRLGFLAALYLGMFWLVSNYWPYGMAAVKLVTGWMACAILGMTQKAAAPESTIETSWPEGRTFRSLAAGLVLAVTVAAAPAVTNWLGVINLATVWGSLLLIGMGLIHLGMTSQPLRLIVALLTTLTGFELMYSALEGSILVTALLAAVNLGLALVGAYLINPPPALDGSK